MCFIAWVCRSRRLCLDYQNKQVLAIYSPVQMILKSYLLAALYGASLQGAKIVPVERNFYLTHAALLVDLLVILT